MKQPLIMLLFSILLISCKQDDSRLPREDINGKWLLVASYDGYVNGGTFTWRPVSFENAHYLEFSADGHYTKQGNSSSHSQTCTGTFRHFPDHTLEISSSCSISTETVKISELTTDYMIIDYQVREGIIRDKYRYID